MISVQFRNVGQGDTIILEWQKDEKKCVGFIDCHLYNGSNQIVEYLKQNEIDQIEFIVLSHFHYDHFSGMADVFDYCVSNKIGVRCFYHSMAPFLGDFYDRIFKSQKIGKAIERFFVSYDTFESLVSDSVQTNNHLRPIELTDKISMTFLAPAGKAYTKFQKQLARKVIKMNATYADVNKLSCIILIESEGDGILLTSDAVKNSFKVQRSKLTQNLVLVQVPHHGSYYNIDEPFWKSIIKRDRCPAIFSVGDEPKDQLPNHETVDFFDSLNYDIYSTNNVYGISSYFGTTSTSIYKPKTVLDSFSKLRKVVGAPTINDKLNGNKTFNLF